MSILHLRDRYFLKPGSYPGEDEGMTGVHKRHVHTKIACALRFVCVIFTPFNVIQGHQFWHQRKSRMLLSVCVHNSIAPFPNSEMWRIIGSIFVLNIGMPFFNAFRLLYRSTLCLKKPMFLAIIC